MRVVMMSAVVVAAAAAVLGSGGPARAGAGVVGTIPVGPTSRAAGTFKQPGVQTWALRLQRGRDYAINGFGDALEQVVVRAPGGRPAARFGFNFGEDDVGSGATFRAGAAGTYFVDVTLARSCDGNTPCLDPAQGRDGGYSLSVSQDCAGSAATRCGIAPGQVLHHLRISFAGDQDWFRTQLRAGQAYRLGLPVGFTAGGLEAHVVDARGRQVVPGSPDQGQSDGSGGTPLTFKVPATGTYYLAVVPEEGWGTYDLSLAPAR